MRETTDELVKRKTTWRRKTKYQVGLKTEEFEELEVEEDYKPPNSNKDGKLSAFFISMGAGACLEMILNIFG